MSEYKSDREYVDEVIAEHKKWDPQFEHLTAYGIAEAVVDQMAARGDFGDVLSGDGSFDSELEMAFTDVKFFAKQAMKELGLEVPRD